ncbi:MAG: helix-hairpin-helix domain-containing protein [Prevotellaceae bacterium]|jgi:DNA uptake protein ComE-like DNA-binding protein|nr:helix-hairpin-helix domain-containing protein [Prevotellaceae bacterium]
MKRCILLIFSLFAMAVVAVAQESAQADIEQLIAEIFEQYAEEQDSEIDFESFYEILSALNQNPVNLNITTREQLENLPFLSENQVENILEFRYLYGNFNTIYELQLIDGLDMTDIRRMLPFVFVGESLSNQRDKIYFREIFTRSKNELLMRYDQTIEQRSGFKTSENQPDTAAGSNYLGEPFYTSIKYKFNFRNRILAGFQAEKDAGEPFFNKYGRGYDFFAASLQLNDFGIFKTVVAGDFRAGFGMGLVIRQNFSMGKSSYVLNIQPRGAALKRYTSTAETNFLRGAGITVRLKNCEITAFASLRKLDADTTGGAFSTLNETGYHRLAYEIDRKNTVLQKVYGGDITLTVNNLQIGLTATGLALSAPIMPTASLSNIFAFAGSNQFNASVHYRGVWRNFNFFGETAANNKFAIATINALSFSPVSIADFIILYRNYSPHYNALFANAFGENSNVTNENGLYIGAVIHPYRRWKVSAYADNFRFPAPRFGTDYASYGADFLLQTDFAYSRRTNMSWRLRYKNTFKNQTDSEENIRQIAENKKWQLRYILNVSFGQFQLKTQLDGNVAKTAQNANTYGIMAFQDINYTFKNFPLKINTSFRFFDAQNYANRLYAYEKDILYAFSIPMIYGLGSRYYLNLNYKFNDNLSVWLKFAQTVYSDDRTSIGSGRDKIDGQHKSDLKIQLRWKF